MNKSLLVLFSRKGLLASYVQTTTLGAVGLVAMALTGLFTLLEFVEQLANVGQGRYHVINALLYVLLGAPARLLQVMPVCMLIGALLALGTLARNSELAAMMSLGMPERRIVRAVLWLVPLLAVLMFLMTELVMPPAQQWALAERRAALSSSSTGGAENLWANDGGSFLHVQHLEGTARAEGVDIYAFAPDGSLRWLVGAARAGIRADGTWVLQDVTRRTVSASQVRAEHLAALPWRSFISPKQLRFSSLPAGSVASVALFRHIQRGARLHQPTLPYQQELWRRLGIPVSMAAMVMIAVPLAFGSRRRSGAGLDLARGIGLGIVFTLGQQLVATVGSVLGLHPAIAALAPGVLVAGLAVLVFPGAYRRRLAYPASSSAAKNAA